MCWSDAYIITDLGDLYLDNFHNNVTQIYGVSMNFGMVFIHTLFPRTRKMIFDRYDKH